MHVEMARRNACTYVRVRTRAQAASGSRLARVLSAQVARHRREELPGEAGSSR